MVQHCKRDGPDRSHGAAFGRRREAQEDRAEHEENEDQRWNDSPQTLLYQRPTREGARLARNARHPFWLHEAYGEHIKREEQDLDKARPPGTGIHVAYGTPQLV